MKITDHLDKLHQQLLNIYAETCKDKNIVSQNIKSIKDEAIKYFEKNKFPLPNLEKWKGTNLTKIINPDYVYHKNISFDKNINPNKIFQCEIQNFETLFFAVYNGFYIYENHSLTKMDNGIIVGSFKQAMTEYPDIVEKYYNKSSVSDNNGLIALNTALAEDGLFVYVPDNAVVAQTMQLVNLVNSDENLFLQTRNLIILGKNSKLTFLQCDDSLKDKNSFKNSVTEFYIDDGATLDHYKLQNKDETTTLVNTTFFDLGKESELSANTITFNSGNIRNEYIVNLNDTAAKANISGLYLIDKTQHVDNQILVRHNAKNCVSSQNFKGILDEKASAIFTGHVYVAEGSQKTEAYQSNKNILLTRDASVISKPFFEIYNDDVRCSHGSTTGKLDKEAMFYLRSRGICERNARLIMMHAFTNEIVKMIKVEKLQERIELMVQKRLKGELHNCDQCILHCNNPDETITFDIDMSKFYTNPLSRYSK